MKITIILPTYNEKVNIQKMIPLLEEEIFPKVKNHELSILVMDDKSPDGTGDEVKKFQKKWKNLVLQTGNKQGLGAAYVRGMKYAMDKMGADAVMEFDADFQHDPYAIPRLIEAMDDGADYVIGSRYIKGGAIPSEWGIHRKFISFFGSLFARVVLFMFRIHDITSGFKLTKSEYLRKVDLEHLYSKYYAYKIQILYEVVRLGAVVKEVPIVFKERKDGSSKLTQKDLFESFWVVIRLRLRDSSKFYKFLVVGGIGFVINAAALRVLVEVFNWNPSIANLAGAAMAIFSNYNLNNLWTFKASRITSFWRYFWKMAQFYATSSFGVIVIQTGTIFLGDRLIGRRFYFLYFIIGTGLLMIWNFTVYNRFIWKEQSSK